MPNSTIDSYKARHEQRLITMINEASIPAPLIKDAMRYALCPGGKRIRALLVYLCGDLLAIPLESLDIMAAAIEMIHAYSLIHDDLPAMDNDDFRRGQPSCHRAFDEATAILAGDGLQGFAIEILLEHLPTSLAPPQVLAVTQALLRACGPSGMIAGQSLDLSLLQHPNVDEDTLQTIHQLKTGQLILACINMVIAAGHPSPQEATALRLFAQHLGLLFQMQDDYLDHYDPSDSLGKGRSSDQANQKQTFATLYSQSALVELIHQHHAKAKQSLAIFANRSLALEDFLLSVNNRIQITHYA